MRLAYILQCRTGKMSAEYAQGGVEEARSTNVLQCRMGRALSGSAQGEGGGTANLHPTLPGGRLSAGFARRGGDWSAVHLHPAMANGPGVS